MIKFIGIINDDYCMEYERLPKDAILIDEEKIDKFGFTAGVMGVIFGFLVLLWNAA